jgi:ribonuclease III
MGNFMEKSSMDENRLKYLQDLEERLNYRFRDIDLLSIALTHRSYVNENPYPPLADNERFEFLGDAVLGLCVSDLLINKYVDFSEGTLSKIRAGIVNEKPLAELASSLQLGDCLLLGKGEENSGGRAKDSLLANSLEAVIAAIYLDSGFNEVKTVLEIILAPLLEDSVLLSQNFDYKTALQEFCQKRYKIAPVYTIIDSSGPDHAKIFEVQVTVADKMPQTGYGKSKKEAEKQAAQKAWEILQIEEN